MKKTVRKKISAAAVALIFSFCVPVFAGMIFTDTIYTIPEEKLEAGISLECIHVDEPFHKEKISLGFGILPSLSLWLEMEFLHRGPVTFKENTLGDSFLRLWYYLGDYMDDRFHMGLGFRFRLPTGPDAYESETWRNLSLGQNEFLCSFVFQADLPGHIFLHGNAGYVFRQEKNRSFYGGLHLNPLEGKTWASVFGLNPADGDAFFYYRNFKNDYFFFSLGLNTDYFYPFVPSFEIYGSVRPYRGNITEDDFPIEGGGVDPVLFGFEVRYFFTRELYASLYGAVNPLWQRGYLKAFYGISFSAEF